jgi:hypothetical protein
VNNWYDYYYYDQARRQYQATIEKRKAMTNHAEEYAFKVDLLDLREGDRILVEYPTGEAILATTTMAGHGTRTGSIAPRNSYVNIQFDHTSYSTGTRSSWVHPNDTIYNDEVDVRVQRFTHQAIEEDKRIKATTEAQRANILKRNEIISTIAAAKAQLDKAQEQLKELETK